MEIGHERFKGLSGDERFENGKEIAYSASI